MFLFVDGAINLQLEDLGDAHERGHLVVLLGGLAVFGQRGGQLHGLHRLLPPLPRHQLVQRARLQVQDLPQVLLPNRLVRQLQQRNRV